MLKEEMQRLEALDVRMLATPDQQISLTDPEKRLAWHLANRGVPERFDKTRH
jgi:hypothetical protein